MRVRCKATQGNPANFGFGKVWNTLKCKVFKKNCPTKVDEDDDEEEEEEEEPEDYEEEEY